MIDSTVALGIPLMTFPHVEHEIREDSFREACHIVLLEAYKSVM